jgi:hypothetical protein
VKEDWDRIVRGEDPSWVVFEKGTSASRGEIDAHQCAVVVVDREASTQDPDVNAETGWDKMALAVSTFPCSPDFWTPTRQAMLDYVGAPVLNRPRIGASLSPLPKIVYVDRQTSRRRLSDDDHRDLMTALLTFRDTGKITFRHAKLEEMSHEEQVGMVADADVSQQHELPNLIDDLQVLLGVHGKGLTHLLWMPQGGVVIEVSHS